MNDLELLPDGPERWRLRCRGWLHATAGSEPVPHHTMRLRLHIPGDPPFEFPIADLDLPSPDVASLLGPRAAAARFCLEPPLVDLSMRLEDARLLVDLPNGDALDIAVGRQLVGRPPDPARTAADRALVMRFESLGNNCELGLLQRELGFERMGLLRFAGSEGTLGVARAIAAGFAGFATPDDLDFRLRGDEWIAASRRYGIEIHTWRRHDELSEDQVRMAMATTLRYQADILLELIEADDRIFVRRVKAGDDLAGLTALHEALRSHGPARLLWVTDPAPGVPHGTIARLAEGLYLGAHACLAPTDWATPCDKAGWLSLLRTAVHIIDGDKQAQSSRRQRTRERLALQIGRLLRGANA